MIGWIIGCVGADRRLGRWVMGLSLGGCMGEFLDTLILILNKLIITLAF